MSAPAPILSVVVPSCNDLNMLKFTILALLDQRPDVPHEIVVADSGGCEETVHFLTAQAENGVIRAVLEQGNPGRAALMNQGARAADGRYLTFLNPGMVVGPGWWEAPLRTLERDATVAATAGLILLTDGSIDHAGLAILEWNGDGDGNGDSGRITGRSIHAGKPAGTAGAQRSLYVQALTGEALTVRAAAFFATGGFSAELTGPNDPPRDMAEGDVAGVDLCLRLGERGWNCIYRHESVMTRLRANGRGNGEVTAQAESDPLTRCWLGRVQADFVVCPDGVVPQENGHIRPYVEPVIRFSDPGTAGRVHPVSGSASSAGPAPQASVVVLTHDDLAATRRCVGALLQHTDDRHELIFVDDGGADEAPTYLRAMASLETRCRLVTGREIQGPAAGYNSGIASARGRFLVLLDSDTIVTQGWLERLITAAQNNPRAGLMGPVTNHAAGMQKLSTVGYDQETLSGLSFFATRHAAEQSGRIDRTMRLAGFCVLIKKELIARIGGLDASLGQGGYEHNDYCLRSHLAGYESLIVRDCFVHHATNAAGAEADVDSLEQIRVGWELFKRKWGIPAATACNAPIDLSRILAGGFDPGRHFHRLPGQDSTSVGVIETISAEG